MCTLDPKLWGWSNCANSRIMQTKQTFPDEKVWIVQNVHHSVSCTVVFVKHVQSGYSCTIVSPFVHDFQLAEIKPKTLYIWHFQFTFRTCVKNSSNQDSHIRKPTVPKFTHYAQEMTLPWHTSGTCPECAPIRLVMLHSTALCPFRTKAKEMVNARFRCYLRLSAQISSNQDGLLRDPTVTKVKHYPQITKFPWTTSASCRRCTAVPRAL